MEYAFDMGNGRWHHRAAEDFRDEAHAREWAVVCGWTFKGAFPAADASDAVGSASRCETRSDNR